MSRSFCVTISVCLGLLCTQLARAEVSVDPIGFSVSTIVMGTIVDDADPISVWSQYRLLPAGQVLNADGHARDDGRPDITVKSIMGDSSPVGVWAYNAGTDHDIAFSEWDGNAWTTTAFLTSSTVDERDPRVAIEADGTVHVVWWTVGATEKIYLATRPAASTAWGPAVLVTTGNEEGRRPSVAVDAGGLRVAYERDSTEPGMLQDVVVATQQGGGGFVLELVGSTVRTDRLDAMIHTEQSHLWVDWKHEATEFGCAEWLGSSWSPIAPEPWTDPSWVGVEGVRKTIRNQVLSP